MGVGRSITGKALLCGPLVACCILAVSADAGERVVLDGVAAHVNSHVVTVAEVAELVEPVNRQLRNTYAGDELKAKLRAAFDDALESLVARYLILDAYEEQEGKIPEWAVDRRIEEIVEETCNGDRSVLMAKLARDRMSFEDLRARVREGIIISVMRSESVTKNVSVSPQAVHDVYVENKARYMRPEMLKLRMIVLDLPADDAEAARARQQAEGAVKRLRAGADFGMTAKKMSKGAKAADGGDWGWVEPGETLRPELVKVAAGLAPTEISDVIELGEQLYILKVDGRRGAAAAPFDEVQSRIARQLRQKEFERLFRAWIKRLKKTAYIKVFAHPSS